jgi:hypothetical protein
MRRDPEVFTISTPKKEKATVRQPFLESLGGLVSYLGFRS